MLKRIVNIFLWTIIGLYTLIIILLHIPTVQTFVGQCASDALCKKFGTKVIVGRVDLGFINRLVIDDSQMYDQNGKTMLKVARISVKINLLALANGQIEINSAQFFGMKANLYKANPNAKSNFQFVIDSLASKDTTKAKTPIDLQINSLILRNSDIRYRCLSKINRARQFSPSNIDVSNISAHIIVNRLTNDSLNVKVKRLSFKERCGINVKSLTIHAEIGRTGARVTQCALILPNSELRLEDVGATYRMDENGIVMPSLRYHGKVTINKLKLSDIKGIVPQLRGMEAVYKLDAAVEGTATSTWVNSINIWGSNGFMMTGNAYAENLPKPTSWAVNIGRLSVQSRCISEFMTAFTGKDSPTVLKRLGDISVSGTGNGSASMLKCNAKVHTDLGDITATIGKSADRIDGHVQTINFDIGKMAGEGKLGHVSLNLTAHGTAKDNISVTGRLYNLFYNGYTYNDISIDGTYNKKSVNGIVAINDPNALINITGAFDRAGRYPTVNVQATVKQLNPKLLNLSNKWGDASFACNIYANINGNDINNADGRLRIEDFVMSGSEKFYALRNLNVQTGYREDTHFLNMDSDFGHVDIEGHFNYGSIARSVKNMIASKLPTMPGLQIQKLTEYNDFTLNASIRETEWLRQLLGVNVTIDKPFELSADMSDINHTINLWCTAPAIDFNGNRFANTNVLIETSGDTLRTNIKTQKMMDKGKCMWLALDANASNNKLTTSLRFKNNESHPLRGVLNASTAFAKNSEGLPTAYIDILESRATIGDTTWHVMPSSITYYKNHLAVEHFEVKHGTQHLVIDGTATNKTDDSLHVNLNGIDVSYVLNLVNFHSVDFYGQASGNAYVTGVFSSSPKVEACLEVSDFKFETGRMGTLYANVGYNSTEGRIEIDATAKDDDNRQTIINGYVSPKHNYIDLGIKAQHTRAEFMEGFCDSFMDNINADIVGDVNVVGPLNNINLVGEAVVKGSVRMSALNTTYWMDNDTVRFVPDEIKFSGDTIRDHNGNIGIMTGSLYHKHLTNLSYDLAIKAHNLLAYDTHSFDGSSFYGTAYVTGDCFIKGKSGEVVIDINAVPEKNSILVYNVSSHNDIATSDYIHWNNHDNNVTSDSAKVAADDKNDNMVNIGTNIRLNFLVNCNPNATLKLIMDEITGDYITLNGEGVLRATYFNKGSFDLYGNYAIDHGIYKLTIQNIIKKDFQFLKGGTISFGGDPYNAAIDMKALYVVNSVSLADLNIGRSFSNNNVRVNCLMNITGTPEAPKVGFSLDIPSLGNDAKQMVYSLINAEEEMNQQVLYLLAVGRFYAQNSNSVNNSGQQYSQTSLAMQSFLSGTISQQINNVLTNVINSNNWNFGANISTGTEGFNDAEYEGLLSGRLLNNRLLINGQFGYRDNQNATTSFIGDFDLKYLLFPNGNLSINVYNKTNDRYFTRNSLNTQGVGIIMKTDFTKFSDLMFWRKRDKAKKKDK